MRRLVGALSLLVGLTAIVAMVTLTRAPRQRVPALPERISNSNPPILQRNDLGRSAGAAAHLEALEEMRSLLAKKVLTSEDVEELVDRLIELHAMTLEARSCEGAIRAIADAALRPSESVGLRHLCALLLGGLGNPTGEGVLTKLLTDKDEFLALASVQGLLLQPADRRRNAGSLETLARRFLAGERNIPGFSTRMTRGFWIAVLREMEAKDMVAGIVRIEDEKRLGEAEAMMENQLFVESFSKAERGDIRERLLEILRIGSNKVARWEALGWLRYGYENGPLPGDLVTPLREIAQDAGADTELRSRSISLLASGDPAINSSFFESVFHVELARASPDVDVLEHALDAIRDWDQWLADERGAFIQRYLEVIRGSKEADRLVGNFMVELAARERSAHLQEWLVYLATKSEDDFLARRAIEAMSALPLEWRTLENRANVLLGLCTQGSRAVYAASSFAALVERAAVSGFDPSLQSLFAKVDRAIESVKREPTSASARQVLDHLSRAREKIQR